MRTRRSASLLCRRLNPSPQRQASCSTRTASGERLLVVGEQGHILYSDDQGSSWTHADVPVSLAITAVAFASPGQAWATAHDGVLAAVDRQRRKLAGKTDRHRRRAACRWRRPKNGSRRLKRKLEEATPDTREDLEWALDDATFAVDDATAAIEDGDYNAAPERLVCKRKGRLRPRRLRRLPAIPRMADQRGAWSQTGWTIRTSITCTT